MMLVEVTLPLARLPMVSRIEPVSNGLQGAGHAVLRTLYSRAYRIGLNEASCLLRGLRKNVSSDLFLVDVARVLAKPAFECVVLLEQQLESLADDIGRVRIDELSVPIEIASDFLFQADLKSCSLRLLRWCFQKCQVFPLLSLFAITFRITTCIL